MRWNHMFKEAVGLGFLGLLLPVAGVAAAEEDASKEISGTFQVQTSGAEGKSGVKSGTIRLGAKSSDGPETIQLIVNEGSGSASATSGAARAGYWIGVGCHPAQGAMRAQLDLPKGQGLVVEQMVPDGPAAKAGVQVFDVLLMAGDAPLAEPSDLVKAVDAAQDKEISLQLLRAGKPIKIVVKGTPRPAKDEWTHAVDGPVAKSDQEAWKKWIESMPKPPAGGGAGGGSMGPSGPMQFRVFAPGMVVPIGPGGQGTMTLRSRVELPENTTVTITRQGKEPAKVTVKQGEESWETTEDQMDKLPEKIRGLVQGGGFGRMTFTASGPVGAAGTGGGAGGGFGGSGSFEARVPAPEGKAGVRDSEDRLERRLEELGRRMDDLRDAIKDLRESRARRDAPQAQPPRAEATKDGGA